MAVRATFSRGTIIDYGREKLQRIEMAIINRLAYLGEQCVNYAREKTVDAGGFGDITGNLRSSIGYMIFANGTQIMSDFKIVKNGAEGEQKGQNHASLVAAKYPEGYVLVVVAGMNYAVYVESKNRDVLTGATRFAEDNLPKMLKELNKNISLS